MQQHQQQQQQSNTMQQQNSANLVMSNQKMPNTNSHVAGSQQQQQQHQQSLSQQQQQLNNSQAPNTPTSIPEIIFTDFSSASELSKGEWMFFLLDFILTGNALFMTPELHYTRTKWNEKFDRKDFWILIIESHVHNSHYKCAIQNLPFILTHWFWQLSHDVCIISNNSALKIFEILKHIRCRRRECSVTRQILNH